MTTFGKVVNGIGSYMPGDGVKRWRVVYKVDGNVRSKGGFKTKAAAQHHQRHTLVAIDKGEYVDTGKRRSSFGTYALRWLEIKQVKVRASTAALYEYQYRIHIEPTFGDVRFRQLTTEPVRRWHAELLKTKHYGSKNKTLSQASVAKVYRLLKQMCDDAVKDGYLNRNPCCLDGAATEKLPTRLYKEPPTVQQVDALAAAVPARYRAMILLAGFGGLRWGELAGLQRTHCVLDVGKDDVPYVNVQQQLTEVNGTQAISEPKTDAGKRRVYLDDELAQDLRAHLAQHTGGRDSAYVFTSDQGEWLRASNFRRRVWVHATTTAKRPGLRFHDLRHAAATLAADEGASTPNLMARLGHASPAAAMRYQHARDERQQSLAVAIGAARRSRRKDNNVVPIREASA